MGESVKRERRVSLPAVCPECGDMHRIVPSAPRVGESDA